jgi:SAM-dependent methyltransferase
MYAGSLDHYLSVGLSGLRIMRLALEIAGATDPKAILDLPCGHGRVLRHIRVAFPAARITACDLDRDGVDFCVREFGVNGVYSSSKPAEIPIGDQFDLIWCGSLLTHLSVRQSGTFSIGLKSGSRRVVFS